LAEPKGIAYLLQGGLPTRKNVTRCAYPLMGYAIGGALAQMKIKTVPTTWAAGLPSAAVQSLWR